MYYPREAEKDHLYNRVILLTFACCVLLGLAAMARQQGAIYAASQWSAVEVTGTVTQVESIPRNDMVKIIHYRYVDDDGQIHEDQCWDKRYAEHAPYDVGQDISLVYSRWLPRVSSISFVLRTYRPGFYIMVSGILLTLLFLGISFKTLGRISTLKQEDRFY
ncbi:DUF3592 domain-containing protein [Pseudomonas sp. 148P]|uniref:DUF3592 domain-containing protein n=1 Tax=Pseudomonas ulcerans TaxID=3115852 RepID=A0ABU7I1J9_9PSED|nr:MULTISPECIES: DUF3592 domain-containing protein [unclassified Pseudomonas]MEE1926464.1 DUF3592 domain-containing protein [Pseudomonas sp. 147P]MEE1937688.1 DUF3592 domain-containing protein [Pseudomonas sp. 148P]